MLAKFAPLIIKTLPLDEAVTTLTWTATTNIRDVINDSSNYWKVPCADEGNVSNNKVPKTNRKVGHVNSGFDNNRSL